MLMPVVFLLGCKSTKTVVVPAPPIPPGLPEFKVSKKTRPKNSAEQIKRLVTYTPTDFAVAEIRFLQKTNLVLSWINGAPPFQPQIKLDVASPWTAYGPITTLRRITNPAPIASKAFFRVQGATSSTGQVLWVKYLTGPMSVDSAQPNSVKTDGNSNTFVAGSFRGTVDFGGISKTTATSASLFLAKYSPAGAVLWVNTSGDFAASANAVTVDSAGNVIILGSFSSTLNLGDGLLTSAGNDDIFIAKFSNAGAIVWSKRFGGTGVDNGYHVGTDAANNIALSGWFGFGFQSGREVDFGGGPLASAGNYDVFVVKLTAAGNHLWSRRCGGTQTDKPKGMAVDSLGNVLYAGEFFGTADYGSGNFTSAGSSDIVLAKYSSVNGARLWATPFGGVQPDSVAGVATDGSANVVMSGSFNSTINFGGATFQTIGTNDFFLVKFGSAGNHIWSTRFRAGTTGIDLVRAVAVDSQDNIIIAGGIISSMFLGGEFLTNPPGAGTVDTFIAKYAPGSQGVPGTHLWSKRYGGYETDQATALAANPSNEALMTGTFSGSMHFGGAMQTNTGGGDGFVVKFSP